MKTPWMRGILPKPLSCTKSSRCSCVVLLLILFSATSLGAENGKASLTIVVSDFDFGSLKEEDMIEYVDYLAFQIDKILNADYVSAFSDLAVEVIRQSAKFIVPTKEKTESSSSKFVIDGVLRRSERGYAVVIRLTEAVSGSRKKTFEYAYRNENELYSGCTGIAIDVANWILGNQEKEDDSVESSADVISLAFIGIKTELGWMSATSTTAGGVSATFLLTTSVFRLAPSFFPPVSLDFILSKNIMANTASYLLGVELNMSIVLVSAGLSFVLEHTPTEQIPYLGLRFRFLDVPPLLLFVAANFKKPLPVDLGFDLLPFTIRWNLKTGKPVFTIGIFSITLGASNLLEVW